MLARRALKVSVYILTSLFFLALGYSVSNALEETQPGEAVVVGDSVEVYLRMSADSEVITRLKKGDIVTIEFEMEGAGWNWCAVSLEGKTVGYANCAHLERKGRKVFERIGSSGGGSYGNTTNVTVVGNQVLVPTRLGYGFSTVQATLLLGPGAGATVINTEVAERLNLDLGKAIKVEAMVVGGGKVEAKVFQLDFLEVGPHRV